MVYAPHTRLTFSGILGSVAAPFEIWSFRLNMLPVSVGPITTADTDLAADAFSTHLRSSLTPRVTLTQVKAARIDANGLYTDDPVISAVEHVGTSTEQANYPPQIALAVSLDTATRGPSGKGRVYLPGPGANLTAFTGRITPATQTSIGNAFAAFLGALNAIPTFDKVVVASSKGANHVVTSIRVGDVLDTIRTRRNQIAEVYTTDVAVSQVNA